MRLAKRKTYSLLDRSSCFLSFRKHEDNRTLGCLEKEFISGDNASQPRMPIAQHPQSAARGYQRLHGTFERLCEFGQLREVGVDEAVLDVGYVAAAVAHHAGQLRLGEVPAFAQNPHVFAERARKLLHQGILGLHLDLSRLLRHVLSVI